MLFLYIIPRLKSPAESGDKTSDPTDIPPVQTNN